MIGMGGSPRSFGRAREDEQPDAGVEKPGPVQVEGGLRLVDGRLVLEVDLALVAGHAMLQDVYDQVRDVVALAVADGFAAATGKPARPVQDILPESGEGAAGPS